MEEAEKVNKDFVADISEFEKENKDAYDAIEKDKAKKEAVEAAGRNRKRSCGGKPLVTPFSYEYKRKRRRRQTEVKNMERVSIL